MKTINGHNGGWYMRTSLPILDVNPACWETLMEEALTAVSNVTGVAKCDILGRRRYGSIAEARLLLYKLCRYEIGGSLVMDSIDRRIPWWQIGRFVGDRTHGTVVHGIRAIQNRLATESKLRAMYRECLMKFEGLRAICLTEAGQDIPDVAVSDGVNVACDAIRRSIRAQEIGLANLRGQLRRCEKLMEGRHEGMVQEQRTSDE